MYLECFLNLSTPLIIKTEPHTKKQLFTITYFALRFVISNVDARQVHTLHTSALHYGSDKILFRPPHCHRRRFMFLPVEYYSKIAPLPRMHPPTHAHTHTHTRGWHFFGNPTGHGNPAGWETKSLRITWLGRERKKFNREWAGPGIVMIPNFTHKYTFYINKL